MSAAGSAKEQRPLQWMTKLSYQQNPQWIEASNALRELEELGGYDPKDLSPEEADRLLGLRAAERAWRAIKADIEAKSAGLGSGGTVITVEVHILRWTMEMSLHLRTFLVIPNSVH